MAGEVIDTNVLTIASAPGEGWVHPRIPLRELHLVLKVLAWVKAFRADDDRKLVMDFPQQTILAEYKSRANMPVSRMYGRQVVQHKFDRGALHPVHLDYLKDGEKLVARLPPEIEALVHDNDDWKMIAAAFEAGAPLVNACDSDWSDVAEQQALALLGIELVQLLTNEERQFCRSEARRA